VSELETPNAAEMIEQAEEEVTEMADSLSSERVESSDVNPAEEIAPELEIADQEQATESSSDSPDAATEADTAAVEGTVADVDEDEPVSEELVDTDEPVSDTQGSGDVEPEAEDAEAESEDAEDTEGEEGEAEPEGPPPEWYVVHGYSGYENRVKKNLEQRIESMDMQDRIFQVVVPTEEEIEIRDGGRKIVERRVFPGYILVEMVLDENSWYVVRNTPGVTGFVGTGSRPTPLSEEEVGKIMKRIESAEPKIKVSFKVGQQVRLTGGAFADFVGRVDELYPEKGRAKVLVSMFGRETPLEVELLHLERV